MPVLSQNEYAQQMVAQLRLLNPSISAEVGTPERLILDTVAQALTDSSIDLVGVEEALNVDSKFGSNLDNFVALFGFSRQKETAAIGFVEFSRTTPSAVEITIPNGTLIASNVRAIKDGTFPQYITTSAVVLQAGTLHTGLVPIEATSPGAAGNVPAGSITNLSIGEPVLGVTSVTNPAPTTGGQPQEDDNSLKVRFKNTVFRNLAGTKDQYLALAVATAYSTKANVIGPVSKYQEYVQVPYAADNETEKYGIEGTKTNYPGTPAPVVIKASMAGATKKVTMASTTGINVGMKVKAFYTSGLGHPEEVIEETSNNKVTSIISSTEVELETSVTPAIVNGTFFFGTLPLSSHANQYTTALSSIPYAKNIWSALPVFVSDSEGVINYFYREGVDFKFNFPGSLAGDALRDYIDGTGLDPRSDPVGSTQPNVTFINVYKGESEIKAISREDTVLLEYSYTSTSSRNSLTHNVTNAVDVYVDGGNEQPSTTIFAAPVSSEAVKFSTEPNSLYYYENFRRDGEPSRRPEVGNFLTPLYQQPVLALPPQIQIGENVFYLDIHYWLVHETSEYQGTIRARDGIEWSSTTKADKGTGTEVEGTEYEGELFEEQCGKTEPAIIEVVNYTYDQNIRDLQAALENSRQVTTDVLAHKAHIRYFKLDITVVYAPSATRSSVNLSIQEAVSSYLTNQYFGSVVRLSDLLQQIHSVTGVENVRWTNDLEHNESFVRVYETDDNGLPLLGASATRHQWGRAGTTKLKEIHTLYITGQPTGGSFSIGGYKIELVGITTSAIETAYKEATGKNVKVTEDVRPTTGVTSPIKSYKVTFEANGPVSLPTFTSNFTGGEYTFDSDFYLRDDELPALPSNQQPADTVPGLIIRPRAQNVWQKT